MTTNFLLRKYLLNYFVNEASMLQDAIFIGLGPTVSDALTWLVSQNAINENKVLSGILHPSGNNTYRVKYLTGSRKEAVPHATNPVPYDSGKAHFKRKFLKVV